MKTYKSKTGLEFVIPIVILFGFAICNSIINKEWGPIIPLFLIPFGVIYSVFFNTKYTIENKNLNIECGFLINTTIDIKTIRKISETYNPISSPAASIDRLEILYNEKEKVLVSPKDKKGFIQSLTEINPNIEVKYRKAS